MCPLGKIAACESGGKAGGRGTCFLWEFMLDRVITVTGYALIVLFLNT
jgi:hypothetical protein